MKPFIFFALALLVSGCATKPPRAIEWSPVNPDLPTVLEPVQSAKASAGKAGESARRAVQIIEKIVPSPAQAGQIASLRLELATTIDQLRLTSEQLDNALLRIPQIQQQVNDMKAWGLAQQARAAAESERAAAERARADREYQLRQRVTKQRDIFVYVIAALGTVSLLLGAQPLITRFSQAFGAYAPGVAVIAWLVAASGAFVGIYAGVQLCLDLIV